MQDKLANRTESPETMPHIHTVTDSHWVRWGPADEWGRMLFPLTGVGTTKYPYRESSRPLRDTILQSIPSKFRPQIWKLKLQRFGKQ